jgi:general secretion pathway protein I
MRPRVSIKVRYMSSERGFTLLEAIVALAIIGITLVPVMSFLSTAAQQLSRAADSNLRASAQTAALAYIETVNPLLNPEGETALSDVLSLRWTSTVVAEPNTEARPGARLAGFRMGFFSVQVAMIRNGEEWFTFDVRKIGYQHLSVPLMPGMDQP